MIHRTFNKLLRPKSVAIFEACVIGLVSALAAVLLKTSVTGLSQWRIELGTDWPIGLVLPGIGAIGGFISGWLIERMAPEASGSGIPQVKAALAYSPIALNLRVATVKLISTSLALGSGLALGRQGPTVQIGAALAAQFSQWVHLSPTYQRQLMAAGAAAGLAAGFNAPIAGVLFVVEELLQDVSDLTLGTAILASFVGGVVSRIVGGEGLIPDLTEVQTNFSVQDIPVLLILGALTGLLGGFLSRAILFSLAFNRDTLKGIPLAWRMSLAGGLTGLILILFPASLRESEALQSFLVLGTVGWQLATFIFVAQFLLILIAYGSGAPGGLFAPSLILGSALGILVITGVNDLQTLHLLPFQLKLSSPTVYALVGMSAFFSAVTRGPITAIVIVFEMTADFDLVLPLMIGSVISYLVAEQVMGGSIYKHLLEWRGIYLEETGTADKRWEGLTADDIMQRRVETLSSTMTLEEARFVFARSHHRGFPVVADGKLVGILTQTDIAKADQRGISRESPLAQLMTTGLIVVNQTDSLAHVLHLLNRHQISRLPVTEGRKLVGIITRADIIRAESDQVSGVVNRLGPKPEPSYPVFQTRSPATGQGRILVPLSNPQSADVLLRFAAAIAQQRSYELECLQVILVPRHYSPAEIPVNAQVSRQIAAHATQLGQTLNISVHTQVRAAHDVAQAILETIKERHIDLIVMGWKGHTSTPGRMFGDAVDTMIRQATCDVVLVKLGKGLGNTLQTGTDLTEQSSFESLMQLIQLNRWLVPIAGGPNAQHAIQLLPSFISLSQTPEITLCQVFPHPEETPDIHTLENNAHRLRKRIQSSVATRVISANSIADAVIELAQTDPFDVIVLGASREGLLQQSIQGNLPEEIARRSDCTVILVRKALS